MKFYCIDHKSVLNSGEFVYLGVFYNSSMCVCTYVPVVFLCSSPTAVSLPPENLMTDATNVSITVMWDVPSDSNGIVSGYRVAILLGLELSAKNVTETTFATEFVGLNPFTNYSISVRAYTDGGRILGDVAMVNATTDIGGMLNFLILYH